VQEEGVLRFEAGDKLVLVVGFIAEYLGSASSKNDETEPNRGLYLYLNK